jgi:hypothetical protein
MFFEILAFVVLLGGAVAYHRLWQVYAISILLAGFLPSFSWIPFAVGIFCPISFFFPDKGYEFSKESRGIFLIILTFGAGLLITWGIRSVVMPYGWNGLWRILLNRYWIDLYNLNLSSVLFSPVSIGLLIAAILTAVLAYIICAGLKSFRYAIPALIGVVILGMLSMVIGGLMFALIAMSFNVMPIAFSGLIFSSFMPQIFGKLAMAGGNCIIGGFVSVLTFGMMKIAWAIANGMRSFMGLPPIGTEKPVSLQDTSPTTRACECESLRQHDIVQDYILLPISCYLKKVFK